MQVPRPVLYVTFGDVVWQAFPIPTHVTARFPHALSVDASHHCHSDAYAAIDSGVLCCGVGCFCKQSKYAMRR